MAKFLYFLISLMVLTSCLDEPDCLRQASSTVILDFRNVTNGSKLNLAVNKVEITGSDSIFYADTTLNSIRVPLNIYTDHTEVIINSGRAVDTLLFTYGRFTRLISPDCGTETYITAFDISEHTADSVRAVERIILPDVPVNYEIFY